MACSSSNKSCYAKSCLRYYNNSAQAFTEIPTTLAIAGSRVVDSGISIEADASSYTVVKKGLYHISADVEFLSTAGEVTFQAYLDGVALPCTLTKITGVADIEKVGHLETDLQFDSCCCNVNHTITFVISGATGVTGTVNHLCTGVTKIA